LKPPLNFLKSEPTYFGFDHPRVSPTRDLLHTKKLQVARNRQKLSPQQEANQEIWQTKAIPSKSSSSSSTSSKRKSQLCKLPRQPLPLLLLRL
jgi:hypothetical protein